MDSILQLEGIHKEYEKVVALQSIDLEIKRGGIFGLLGPNGAGKTSMIRIITHITMPDSGKISFNFIEKKEQDPMNRIGYLPEERGLYPDMKIKEQLKFFAQMKGLTSKEADEKIKYWLSRFQIEDWAGKKAQELSKGMQQIVQFLSCVIHDPELMILDEPFSGLDPINSNRIKEEILRLSKEGKTIIFSTHQMSQVEELCEDIALINKGVFILKGNIKDIKQSFKKHLFEIKYHGDQLLPNIDGFEITQENAGQALVKCQASCSYSQLLKKLSDYVEIYSFTEVLPSLNEIFIEQVTKAKQAMEADHE